MRIIFLFIVALSACSCHHYLQGGDIAKAQRTGQDTLPSGAYFVYNGSRIGVVDSNPKWLGIGVDSGVMTVAQKDTLYSSITVDPTILSIRSDTSSAFSTGGWFWGGDTKYSGTPFPIIYDNSHIAHTVKRLSGITSISGKSGTFYWEAPHDSALDIWEQPNRGLPVTYPKVDSSVFCQCVHIDSIEWIVWVKNDHLFMDTSIRAIADPEPGKYIYDTRPDILVGLPLFAQINWIFLKRKNTQTIIVNQNK